MALSSDSNLLFAVSGLEGLSGARIAIISTEWNEAIVARQLEGCMKILQEYDTVITHNLLVPGAVEIPFACRAVMNAAIPPEVVIAFGAVIRGGTPHFEYVCESVVQGITHLNVTEQIPVIFGVLTLDTIEQAWERLGGTHGHKGEEAALAALKMVVLNRKLRS